MPIFKDECVYTFDNQESEFGVDVCLSCFIGTSPDPAHDFTNQHSRTAGHSAFLNLKKRMINNPHKPQVDDFSDPKSKQIKLSIQPDKEEEQFELVHEFKSLKSDNEQEFGEQIDKVLKADSYAKTQELESWELELNPCEHVAMFESTLESRGERPSDYKLLSHCSACELDQNLWFCLECGNLGCGRRQFDGSGGNNHGVDHYEQTKHPLAVKLGSITPDGHVDVFCYACNDDIKDPNIRDHLSYWGIDIAKQTKTEKSMTELQLEQNLSWDFSSSDNGEAVHGPGFTGMKNLGNSCYMNSVMQSLFNIPEMKEVFKFNDPQSDHKLGGPEDLTTQLRKLGDGLNSGRYESVSPQMLRYLVGKNHAEFATARQQDAFEYFTYLITQIQQKTKIGRDLPTELFGFQSERRLACLDCDAVRYITSNEENVSVAVPIVEMEPNVFKPVTMNELLNIYTQTEEIESKCPKCDGSRASTYLRFKSFPRYFVVNVRRFRLVNWVPQKVDVPLVVEGELKLDSYISKGPQEGENVIEDLSAQNSNEAEKFSPDPMKLEMLVSMGFSDTLSTQGLKIARERGYGDGDFDAAIEIIISGEAQQALESAPSGSGGSKPDTSMLESMGFTPEQSLTALKHTSSVEEAVEWLFSGNYENIDPSSEEQEEEQNTARDPNAPIGESTLPANYTLTSTVCHKGASVHVGHYVAAVRKGDETYLFNDEKVTRGSDVNELEKFAYIYIFGKVEK